MPREIQDEILVQVCNIRHAALPWQAEHLAFAFDPRIVGPAMHIHLRNCDHLMSDAPLLVIPMISLIASPADFCTAELQRLRQCQGHWMEVDINEASVQSNDRQSWGMSLLCEQIRNHGQGRDRTY